MQTPTSRKKGRACEPPPPLTKSMTLETAGSTTAMTYATTTMMSAIKTSAKSAKTMSKQNSSRRMLEDRRR